MGKIKTAFLQMTIRRSMSVTFLAVICSICLLSGATIFLANLGQQAILDRRGFIIQTGQIEKKQGSEIFVVTVDETAIERSPLTPKQQTAYILCMLAMIGLPMLYFVAGILLASRFYYCLKLRVPILELQNGIARIQNNDLDFTIDYQSTDELGALCASMEKMRLDLRQNNKKLWELLEQRKALNASVAHDLRTPITVLKGYLDYLQKNVARNNLTPDDLSDTLNDMRDATDRLEHYVNCVRDVETLEDMDVTIRDEDALVLAHEINQELDLLESGKEINFTCHLSEGSIRTDKQSLFRIMENLVGNAVQFAKQQVNVELWEEANGLVLRVRDDGPGFSATDLAQAGNLFYSVRKGREHFGVGLFISRILCEKLGGSLTVGNGDNGGACVTAKVMK